MKRKKDKWYNLMKCSVANLQLNVKKFINGYSLYVHLKYHTVVILYSRLCTIEYCFYSDILLRLKNRKVDNLFKVKNEIMTLLLTLKRFHKFFWCLHCWLTPWKCRVGKFQLGDTVLTYQLSMPVLRWYKLHGLMVKEVCKC